MKIQDIHPADVLCFSVLEGDLISRLIAKLTGCAVSHTALGYSKNGQIIEEVGAEGSDPGGVEINEAAPRFSGRTVTVRRLARAPTSMSPVLDAADTYIGQPFGVANLITVGLLLIYQKRAHMPPLMQEVVTLVLEKIADEIMSDVNKHRHPGRQPMFCSQFAFQCYQDAGAGYDLHIVDGVLLKGRGAQPQAQSLLDAALAYDFVENVGDTPALREELDELLLRLEVSLSTELELSRGTEPCVAPDPRILRAVRTFAEAVCSAYDPNCARALALLKQQEAHFVTPADLYQNCPDLTTVGTIQSSD